MDRLFSAAVGAIYDAAPDPSLWPRALQAVADCFADVGANLIWPRKDGRFGIIVSPGLEASAREYEREWYRQDIRAIRAAEQHYWLRDEALTDRHMVTDEEIESHPFYTQFLARYGLRWVAGTGVSPDPFTMVGISVQRASTRQPYSDAELELLTRIGRHAEKALRLSIRLLDAELCNFDMREALARVGIGVLVLEDSGRVVFSNPVADNLLGDGLELTGGRLRIIPPAVRSKVEQAIASTLRGVSPDLLGNPKPLLVERARSPHPLTTSCCALEKFNPGGCVGNDEYSGAADAPSMMSPRND